LGYCIKITIGYNLAMKNTNLISMAVEKAGLKAVAAACGVSYQSVRKWEAKGHLPLTEWAGVTNYAKKISDVVGGEITVDDLLSQRPPAPKAA